MGWITSVKAYSEEKEESERIEGEGILPYHCLMVPAASARMSIYPQIFLIFNRDPPIHQAISYTIYCFLNLSPYISHVSILGIQLTKDHLFIGINRKQSQGNVCVCASML